MEALPPSFRKGLLDDLADTDYAELIRVPYLMFSLTSKPTTFITLDSNLIPDQGTLSASMVSS